MNATAAQTKTDSAGLSVSGYRENLCLEQVGTQSTEIGIHLKDVFV